MAKPLTIAVTKIGDLLLNNRITIAENGQSIEKIKLVIPEYQRPYKWTAKNANQLLDDITEAKNANREVYRVGTLILHRDEKDEHLLNIVDGQQRTITFSLLLKALGEENIEFLQQDLANNYFNIVNIPNNYRGLKRRVNKIGDEKEYKELLAYIKNNCQLIVVITDDISEAFQFFDSQNARGKKLYPHDLLKAYHLREMNHLEVDETEKIVKMWEELDQKELSALFKEYLYRIKEWIKGNRSEELTEHNMEMFKGVTRNDNYPYAKFYKGAFSYADSLNHSSVPFVTGTQYMNPFQLDTPIVAGKPFFEYTKHYFDILADIQNNDKYEGCYINDNEIIKTLNLRKYKNGTGNTQGIAEEIQKQTGAELFEITLVNPYSNDYNTVLDEAQRDQSEQARPELASHVENMEEYDTIILGYPNWWASIPMPIASFLEEYDFSGKTIIPFCSHGGGRFGQSLTAIEKLAPDAIMGEALSIHYSGGSSMPDDVREWLSDNGIER